MPTPKTETGKPTAKVMGGTMGAAFATLVIWVLTEVGLTADAGVEVAPPIVHRDDDADLRLGAHAWSHYGAHAVEHRIASNRIGVTIT